MAKTFIAGILLLAKAALAQEITVPEFVALKKASDAEIELKVEGPYRKSVGDLKAEYSSELGRAESAAQRSGKLDEVLALKKERESVTAGQEVATTGNPTELAALNRLRAAHLAAMAKLGAERARRLQPLSDKYNRDVNALITKLTKEGKVDEAKYVMDNKGIDLNALAGVWITRWGKDQRKREIFADGTFSAVENGPGVDGQWVIEEKRVLLKWKTGDRDEWFLPLDVNGMKGRSSRGFDFVVSKQR